MFKKTPTKHFNATASRRNEVLSGERVHTSSQIVNTTLGFQVPDHMSRENALLVGVSLSLKLAALTAKKWCVW